MGKVFKLPPLAPKLVVPPPTVDVKSGGADADVQVSGTKSLKEVLMNLSGVEKDAAGVEMSKIMHEVILDSEENYVPVLNEVLRKSGDSDGYEPGSTRNVQLVEIRAWYAAPADGLEHNVETFKESAVTGMGLHVIEDPTKYALIQHEDASFKHPRDHGAGANVGWKYLERPFIIAAEKAPERIAAAIGRSLGQ